MSYHIYTTNSLVLSSRPFSEADRIYAILTRDLGLLRARALGVRKERSKLRGALEPVSYSKVSLIRGKEYWRVTSAELVKKVEPEPEVLRPLSLLEKLVVGEAPHSELLDALEKRIFSEERDEMFEIGMVAEMLYQLGYLSREALKFEKKELLKAINDGIEASQLALE